MHTTTAFVKAVKESADCLKKNVALIYERDPFGSDSDSDHDAANTDVQAVQPNNGKETPAPVLKEAVVHEARKVVVQEEAEEDARSDDQNQGATAIGENRFLTFDIDDLLTENTADFNLDLCKVQVSRLLSKVRVAERVEAAKDMEQWMSVLETSNAESEVMLTETEAATDASQHGLEERRQDIATLVGQSSIKTSELLKGFMQKVSQYRLDTLDMLRARYAKSAYDEFWDGLQDTIDRETTRRRSKIDEEHTMEVAAEVHRRLVGDAAQGPVVAAAVNPSVVAAHMLEAISLQQDETTYRKTRLEMETGKRKQYENILLGVDGGSEEPIEGQEGALNRLRLSDAENDLLAQVRVDARKAACDSILATEEGGRLAEKASGKDMEDQNQLFFECQKLKLKAQELERQLKSLSTPEERIKELEQQVAAKCLQMQRAAKRSERKARMREQQVGADSQSLEPDDMKGPDAASLVQWLLSLAPSLASSVEQVQAEYQKLRATYDIAKETLLSERMESFGLRPGDSSKPKLETLQQKLQESKEELQILIEEKAHLDQAVRGPKKKPKGEANLSDDQVMTRAGGDDAEDGDLLVTSFMSQSSLFDCDGKPIMVNAVLPDPSEFTAVGQSRPYLAELTKACQLLEKQRADLSAKLRRANGEHPEENDDQLGGSRESQAEPARRKEASGSSTRRSSVGNAGGRDTKRNDSNRLGGDKGSKASASAIPSRPTRKGRQAIMGALKPVDDQPEVTEEAKAGVLALLAMFKELEDVRAQINYSDSRIHRAKSQHDGKDAARGEESDDDDGAPDANRELRREVQRKQRELNQLRKRWAEDRGNREKAVTRHAALAGSAVRYLLQERLQAEAQEDNSSDSSTESSSQSDASSKES
ncbi:unnamed protein product [Symbiodinium pilosum]|uniref:Uncharacterized protein n=1 Tax=Symbiodinium pilosum TaxID=2952 RepID=A0A812U7G7_SYMPI|nr:unnamed protein product [Symbiodinium pilosum]